jgi:hypothetical protein
MKLFVVQWSQKFNKGKYPPEFYFGCLQKIREALETNDKRKLAKHLSHILHWKDGKVKIDEIGTTSLNGRHYSLGNPKPNTLNVNHNAIFSTSSFFNWAKELSICKKFDPNKVNDLKKDPFQLYGRNSFVIPFFILHSISPLVFPLYDQHVERAKRIFTGAHQLNKDHSDLNIATYREYEKFFNDFIRSSSEANQIESINWRKTVDDALMAFGSWLTTYISKKEKNGNVLSRTDYHRPSRAFKSMVIDLISSGKTQRQAMEIAAKEHKLKLRDSYFKYPGSHIYNWRTQN